MRDEQDHPHQMESAVSVTDFVALARRHWNNERRTPQHPFDTQLPLIQEFVDFAKASPELKVHLAETILRESTPRCGAYSENGDARWFLHCAAREIQSAKGLFDGRRLPVIRAAFMLLAHAHFGMFDPPETRERYGDLNVIFGMGGSALASIYLLSQLEYVFRVKGAYLDEQGIIGQSIPSLLRNRPGFQGKNVGDRVNSIARAFDLYVHGNTDPLAQRLATLEEDVGVSDRLDRIRPLAMHGTLADASAEGLFYGLLLSMFLYSEP